MTAMMTTALRVMLSPVAAAGGAPCDVVADAGFSDADLAAADFAAAGWSGALAMESS
jgi:hypothetical protein